MKNEIFILFAFMFLISCNNTANTNALKEENSRLTAELDSLKKAGSSEKEKVVDKNNSIVKKYCDEYNAWLYVVEIEGSKIVLKLYPGKDNDYHPNKDVAQEIVEGKYDNGKITIPVPEDCQDCGEEYSTSRFFIENNILHDANNEGGYNEYYLCE